MKRSTVFYALALFGLSAVAAQAHPVLKSTVPSSDKASSTVVAADAQSAPPNEIRLTFSEGVMANFSGLEIKDKAGKTIATGPTSTDPTDTKQMIVPIKTLLSAGRYTVIWHAVSEDTHRVKGEYTFTIGQ